MIRNHFSSFQAAAVELRLNQLESRVVPAGMLGVASSYNAFVFGNFSSWYSDTEGRVAAGGDVSLTGYSVGARLNSNDAGDSLVVGGNLNFTNGQVANGNIVYGNSSYTSSLGLPNGTSSQGEAVDFDAAYQYLTYKSSALASLTPTGTVTNQWGGLYLNGNESGVNVFNVDASQLNGVWGITVNVPQGSSVIINVTGNHVSLKYMGIQINGTDASKVLWNFSEATCITMEGIGMQGSILAPYASVHFNNGQINGTLIAQNFCGNGQLNWVPNQVCLCTYVTGTVYAETCYDSEPVANATVILTGTTNQGDTVYETTKTDDNGFFGFGYLQPGDYTITLELPSGYSGAWSASGSLGGNASGTSITGIDIGYGSKGVGYQFTVYR